MWMHCKSGPALAVLALSAVGFGILGFQGKAVDAPTEVLTADKATVPANQSPARTQATPGKARAVSATMDEKGLEAVQRRLAEELTQLRKQRDLERKQYEEIRQSLSAELFKKEGALRKLEQKVASERDKQARVIAPWRTSG